MRLRWDGIIARLSYRFNFLAIRPPLGRSTEVIAGQPIEAFVKTSVYLVLKNSLSAASCPALRETVSLPHFCSNQISYRRVDASASTPLTTRKFWRLLRESPSPWI